MKFIFLFIISHFVSTCFSQTPVIQWQKSLGGSGYDDAYSVQQTKDFGYIIVGTTTSTDGDVTDYHGYGDCWIVKLDSFGKLMWEKAFGGTESDEAYSVEETIDGGYIFAGYTSSIDGDVTFNHGLNDCWIVKLDADGNIQWQKTYGGSNTDEANSIEQTTDGGYIVGGYTNSNDGDVSGKHDNVDFWVFKIDETGNLQWQKCLGGSDFDQGNSIEQCTDGGYIVAGVTESNDGDVKGHHSDRNALNNYDYWVAKLDASGNLQWQNCLGGSGDDWGSAVRQTPDKGYIVAGYTNTEHSGDVTKNHGYDDYWVAKLDSNGKGQWQKSLGGSSNDDANTIALTKDGGYLVAGGSSSSDGQITGHIGASDYWIAKLNARGKLQRQFSLGGTNSDGAFSIQQTSDGGFVVAGGSSSNDVDVTGNHGFDDFWVVRLASSVFDENKAVTSDQNNFDQKQQSNSAGGFSIYPTIVHSSFNINLQIQNSLSATAKIKVINEMGEIVLIKTAVIVNGILQTQITMDAALPKEMYLVRVIVGDKIFSGKIFYE